MRTQESPKKNGGYLSQWRHWGPNADGKDFRQYCRYTDNCVKGGGSVSTAIVLLEQQF